MNVKGWVALVIGLMFAGGVITSYAEWKFKYNLYTLIATKIFRRKITIAIAFLFLYGCGIKGYHWAGGTGDVTHAIEPGARVIVPNGIEQAEPYPTMTCDASLWQHVYNPNRLEVHRNCVSVTGTIVDATHGKRKDGVRKEADGDCHGWLKLDAGEGSYLNDGNMSDEEGNLVYEVVCLFPVKQKDAVAACQGYKNKVKLAPVGSHVRITGSWVKDDNHARWNEIHPVTSITLLP